MRTLFLIMVIAGALLRIAYPWYVSNFSGELLTELPFYQRGSNWKPVEAQFDRDVFPIGLKVRLVVDAPSERLATSGSFVLKVRGPERISYREVLDFTLKPVGDGNGTTQELWQNATTLQYSGNEPYTIELIPLPDNRLSIKSAELRLIGNILSYDGRFLFAGAGLMAVGGLGFVLASLRNSRRRRNRGEAPKPRWGRGEK